MTRAPSLSSPKSAGLAEFATRIAALATWQVVRVGPDGGVLNVIWVTRTARADLCVCVPRWDFQP